MRVKTGPYRHRKHKKILKLAKGYRMTRSRLLKPALETVLHAGEYAFAGRKLRKRDFRKLWISRINASLKDYGISYSRFVSALKKANISLDRRMLSDLAVSDPQIFKAIVDKVKGNKASPSK